MAQEAANLFAGIGPNRPRRAWRHVYRALDHGTAKTGCESAKNLNFPAGILSCAAAFVELQEARHSADYDPDYRLSRAEAMIWVARADQAIRALRSAPRRDRRAFAVQLLLKRRQKR
jgi:hypothetical protein